MVPISHRSSHKRKRGHEFPMLYQSELNADMFSRCTCSPLEQVNIPKRSDFTPFKTLDACRSEYRSTTYFVFIPVKGVFRKTKQIVKQARECANG